MKIVNVCLAILITIVMYAVLVGERADVWIYNARLVRMIALWIASETGVQLMQKLRRTPSPMIFLSVALESGVYGMQKSRQTTQGFLQQ